MAPAIAASRGFKAIALDLFVVAAVAALALCLLRRCGTRALLLYLAWVYTAGLAATVALKGM